ncbi:prolyl oligopeptidase family serine peptidase [bacterium]|nr:prolyl oligopeptidase family serine peptidase [bacterium]
MKPTIINFILLLLILVGCKNTNKINDINEPLLSKIEPVSDIYFDTLITDHYRQIEDLNDTTVINWFKEQGQYANTFLSNISGRKSLIDLMKKYDARKLYHIDKIKVTKNDSYFYLKRKSEEEIFKLYYRKSLSSIEEMLFQPGDLKWDDKNPFIIYDYAPDWDGNKIAIALASRGSDKMQIVIYDLQTKSILSQIIKNCFNASSQIASWLPDNKGFLYLAYNNDTSQNINSLLNTKTMYYKIGDDVSDAIDVFSKTLCPNFNMKAEDFPNVSFGNQTNKYLLGVASGPNSFDDGYYLKIDDFYKGKLNWKPLYKKEHKVIRGTFVDDDFVFISVNNAPNGNISRINLHYPDFNSSEILVQENEDEVIQNFKVTSSGLYYNTTKNGVEAKLYFYNNEDKNIHLPEKFGRIFIDNKSYLEPDLWVTATGWLTDKQRMKYDIKSNQFTEENLTPKADFPEFEDFIIEELSIKSHDGELVPLSVISKKGIKKDGNNPCLLYGYGAYRISWRPYFLPDWLTWVENGGILCFSHIRGGGEKGDNWHKMGQKNNKPNSWKDFIACSEFLIENKYTSNKELVIYGGSAGGIVIGRSMTERPDLYAAVISEVGMLNAVRFENMPGGPNHAKEFGYITDSIECKGLIEMDAYLHIDNSVKYPPFLAVVGMNDLRVSPWQSGKFVAKLQENNWSENTTLMMIDFNEGHYFNSTKTKSMEKLASIFSFAFWQTDPDNVKLNHHEK